MNTIKKILLITTTIVLFYNCSTKSDFSNGLIPVKYGDKWGYINYEGKYEINPQFDTARYFINGIALVRNGKEYGYINTDGKYIINPQYKYALDFSEDLACVVAENKSIKYINEKGKVVINLKEAEFAGSFHNGLARVRIENKWGFIDKKGNISITPKYIFVKDFSEGLAPFMIYKDDFTRFWGCINKDGDTIIKPDYWYIDNFINELAVVADTNSKYGYLNHDGKYEINPQFDNAQAFIRENTPVELNKKWGIINKQGKLIINPQYDYINPNVLNELIAVKLNDKYGYIDINGKNVINPQYDQATSFIGDIAIIKNNDKIGLIDKNGLFIANPQFDEFIFPLNNILQGGPYTGTIITDTFNITQYAKNVLQDNAFFLIPKEGTIKEVIQTYGMKVKNLYKDYTYVDNLDIFNTPDIEINRLKITYDKKTYTDKKTYEYYTDYWGKKHKKVSNIERNINNDAKVTDIKVIFLLKNRGVKKEQLFIDTFGEILINKFNLTRLKKEIQPTSNNTGFEYWFYNNITDKKLLITFKITGQNKIFMEIVFENNSKLSNIEI